LILIKAACCSKLVGKPSEQQALERGRHNLNALALERDHGFSPTRSRIVSLPGCVIASRQLTRTTCLSDPTAA
jgi:hypothetical protein